MNPSQLMQTRLNQLTNSGLNFDAPKEEMDLIIKIVARIMQKWGPSVEPKLLAMELTACHLNGTRLNLWGLSLADDNQLQRDVFGIRRHIDRDTGKLKEGFEPFFKGHTLYEDGDEGAPEQIKDRNGQIVLGLCKVCRRAEAELVEPCQPRNKLERLQ